MGVNEITDELARFGGNVDTEYSFDFTCKTIGYTFKTIGYKDAVSNNSSIYILRNPCEIS